MIDTRIIMAEGETKIVRPLKLIGCVCGCIGVILVALCTLTCHWLEAKDFHQGVWQLCTEKGDEEECLMVTDKKWILVCLALCIVALVMGTIAGCLSIAGLCVMKSSTIRARSVFRTSAVVMFLAVLSLLAAVILFPIMFIQDIEEYRIKYTNWHWYFSWSYGIAWGAGIFLFGSGVLLAMKEDYHVVGGYGEKNGHQIELK